MLVTAVTDLKEFRIRSMKILEELLARKDIQEY